MKHRDIDALLDAYENLPGAPQELIEPAMWLVLVVGEECRSRLSGPAETPGRQRPTTQRLPAGVIDLLSEDHGAAPPILRTRSGTAGGAAAYLAGVMAS